MNSVNIIGRLGKDPELRYTSSGTAVCSFSIAVDEGSGDNKRTHWFDIVVWREQAENCAKHLAKGRQVAISGRLQTRTWETQDGQKRKVVEIVAGWVDFLGGRPDGQRQDGGREPGAEWGDDEGDVPF